ncbi:MAG: 30S ribosomal protein S20 [Nitrospirae bacterium]|uniref:30S ribosomal protein S20 n=1 Tax=Candidatus Magnetobacterium casense TaxID=1455061 RepID=UPI000696A287|nr:30S ribosomal protein S20 [Candidatus Magnetobacterium casensis]MBF0338008.1 30S ribosomal protein S20 [Nitrospirota bacterium]
MAARSRPKRSISVLKRTRQAKKRQLHNRMVKSKLRTLTRGLEDAIKANNMEKAKELLVEVIRAYDKAATKGVLHDNTASRKISRLSARLHALMGKAA